MKKTASAGNCPRLLSAAVLAASFFITACGENQPQKSMSEPVDLGSVMTVLPDMHRYCRILSLSL